MQRYISEAYVLPRKITSINVEEVPKLTAISKLERVWPSQRWNLKLLMQAGTD